MELKDLSDWSGTIEEFARKVAEVSVRIGLQNEGEPTIRLIRDYLQRGILGPTTKSGREIVFGYDNLMRHLAARVLLRDGWPLTKISQHFDTSSREELEALVPGLTNTAIAALHRIKHESASASSEPTTRLSHRAARVSSIHSEMREAMRRLGLPPNSVATEQLTLIALAPWCQVLIQSDRLSHITIEEAEDIGRGLTAGLLNIVIKRRGKND